MDDSKQEARDTKKTETANSEDPDVDRVLLTTDADKIAIENMLSSLDIHDLVDMAIKATLISKSRTKGCRIYKITAKHTDIYDSQ